MTLFHLSDSTVYVENHYCFSDPSVEINGVFSQGVNKIILQSLAAPLRNDKTELCYKSQVLRTWEVQQLRVLHVPLCLICNFKCSMWMNMITLILIWFNLIFKFNKLIIITFICAPDVKQGTSPQKHLTANLLVHDHGIITLEQVLYACSHTQTQRWSNSTNIS